MRWNEKTCEYCGEGFTPKRRGYGTKTCSGKCRTAMCRRDKKLMGVTDSRSPKCYTPETSATDERVFVKVSQ